MKAYASVEACIASFPREVQAKLQEIRRIAKNLAPQATETISYGIPTVKLNGNLLHYCAYKSHIGFYPGSTAISVFQKDLANYKTSKGAIQFPLDQDLPHTLIEKIVRYRVKEQTLTS